MDFDEKYITNEESRIEEEHQCEACGSWITGYEAIDPFIIDGRVFCITCASNLTVLRIEEYISSVSNKTKNLK